MKTATRRASLLARDVLSAADRSRGDEARTALLLDLLAGVPCVAAYVSMGTEPGTDALRSGLAAAGTRVLLPRLRPDGGLDFVPDGPLIPGLRGTRAPSGLPLDVDEADVVLMPALAVDRAGTRLGRGGGSYDRALAGIGPERLVALLHPGELITRLPAQQHDRPVGAVALPDGIVAVGPGARRGTAADGTGPDGAGPDGAGPDETRLDGTRRPRG